MNILEIVILVFCFIEFLNITILYWFPEFKFGNGVGIFKNYNNLKNDEKNKDFINYMVSWVAGTKLIFIIIGIVVVIFGNLETQIGTVIGLILSIMSFYYRLFPLIKKMDSENKIIPKGYSKTLNFMILSFVFMFLVSLVVYLLSWHRYYILIY